MKKRWEDPCFLIQKFEPNEYVAACITGQIACAIPGNDPNVVDGEKPFRKDEKGMWHGMCGAWANISFNGDTANGYEVTNGTINTKRPIFEIDGYIQSEGDYNVTWKSTDNENGSGTYEHKGVLKISNVDGSRPNHS